MRVLTILLLATSLYCTYAAERSDKVYFSRSKLNGRLDYLEVHITALDLVPGTDLTEEVKNHVRKLSAPDDVIGVLLDQKLGGPGNETYNALPMNPSTQEIWKTKVIDPTYNYLMANKSRGVMFVVMPLYENVDTMRPYGLFFSATELHTNTNAHITKGYIPNAPKAISQSEIPYVYSTGRVWIVERKNQSFELVGAGGGQSSAERVEMVVKGVRLSDLSTGTELNEISKNHTRALAGEEPYVPGLLLSQKLGGKGDDPYNVVPMNPKAVEQLDTRVVAPILAFFADPANKDKHLTVGISLVYADSTSTRPVGFLVFSRLPPSFSLFISNQ